MSLTIIVVVFALFFIFVLIGYIIARIYNKIIHERNRYLFGSKEANMMKCKSCEADISIWARACPHCGHHYPSWVENFLLITIATIIASLTLLLISAVAIRLGLHDLLSTDHISSLFT